MSNDIERLVAEDAASSEANQDAPVRASAALSRPNQARSTVCSIRLIIRRAFGLHPPEALIALAKLSLGGLCPPLPGRS